MTPSRLVQHIAAQPNQRLTFAQYMDWVLYDPIEGYYTGHNASHNASQPASHNASHNASQPAVREPIGPGGDFITSVSIGPDLGELLAVQMAELWELLGRPEPFTLLEMGAGQGLLALDCLGYGRQHFPACWAALRYLILERSAGLRDRQRQRLEAAGWGDWIATQRLQWVSWDEIAEDTLVGCCFSNELVDAFPVHLVEVHQGQLQEVYVTEQLQEVLDQPSTPRLGQYFRALEIDLCAYPDGYRTEVNLAAQDWLVQVSCKLQRGYLVTIDYGYSSDRYYHPNRQGGTLQAYSQHRHHNDPYLNPTQQDLTAHVNFTALERWGEQVGLKRVGFTQQALFLMALGLGDRIAGLASDATDAASIHAAIQRRQALHQFIDPSGFGNFGVLLQGKDVPPTIPLGWQMP